MNELVMPFPPTTNNLYRNAGSRGRVKTSAYRLWLQEAALLLRAQRAPRVAGSYSLAITADRPDNRRRDLGNLEKAVSDCLVQAGVVEDDHLAKTIVLSWSDAAPKKPGAIRVSVVAA